MTTRYDNGQSDPVPAAGDGAGRRAGRDADRRGLHCRCAGGYVGDYVRVVSLPHGVRLHPAAVSGGAAGRPRDGGRGAEGARRAGLRRAVGAADGRDAHQRQRGLLRGDPQTGEHRVAAAEHRRGAGGDGRSSGGGKADGEGQRRHELEVRRGGLGHDPDVGELFRPPWGYGEAGVHPLGL